MRHLTVQYGAGRRAVTAVDSVDLEVPPSGTLGLVGESGSGKSTVARALVGLTPIASGTIRLGGVDYSAQSARETRAFRRRVQMVFQDPYASLNPRMTVGESIGEAVALREASLTSVQRTEECARALDLVGLPADALGRYPHQFSGGQRQRIAIARALAVEPEVILSDEVTSALDVSTQATILNLMRSLQRRLGVSYVFISHDLAVVRIVSDTVAVMSCGRIVECGPTDRVLVTPSHPYTARLLEAVPTLAF